MLQILAHYPSEDYSHEAYRVVVMGTDVFFRCPTRQAARALTAAGVDVYLYHFDFKFPGYFNPSSSVCEFDSEVRTSRGMCVGVWGQGGWCGQTLAQSPAFNTCILSNG